MKQIVLLNLLFNLSAFAGYSQSIALNIKSFYGIWNNELTAYNYGGGGLELLYEQPLKKGALISGIELRTIDWGNQFSMNIGYKAPYISKDKWELNGMSTLGIGLALFKENPLFVWSIGYMPAFTWLRKKRIDMNIGLGIRYTHNPAYINYGKINQVLEFPIKIGFKYNLKGKKA